MAKLKNGILGPFSGKLGPVVGATWKDIPYLRQLPKKMKIPPPRSIRQIANQGKMTFLNHQLVPFHPYITIGFSNLAIRKTAINAAYSVNFHQAVTGVYPDLGFDYTKMIISKGNLPGLTNPIMELIQPDAIQLSWENGADFAESYNDQLMVVLYAPELHLADGFIGGTRRAEKIKVFNFDTQLIGKPLEVYLSVISLNQKKIADSVYMGRIQP